MEQKKQVSKYTTMRVLKRLNKQIKRMAIKDGLTDEKELEAIIVLGMAELRKPRFLREISVEN